MPENPLLPDAELRRLYRLQQQSSRAEGRTSPGAGAETPPSRRRSTPRRSALLAATILQLQAGDILIAAAGDHLPVSIASSIGDKTPLSVAPALFPGAPLLSSAAAAASLGKAQGSPGLVLAFVTANQLDPSWEVALRWAQEQSLPLVVACADPSGSRSFTAAVPLAAAEKFTWTGVERLCRKLQLPVLSVDGDDAVAVYRVMQESALRARAGGGPAVLWAMLPVPSPARQRGSAHPGPPDPVQRLKDFMQFRRIRLTER